jgi:hypothetical protein
MNIIDRNALAAYLIALENPGCPKSMLWTSPKAYRIVTWMLDEGYLMEDGRGVRLTERGERMGAEWAQVAYEAGQGGDARALAEATVSRYLARRRRR